MLDATFSVEHSSFGVLKNHELKPGGKDIPVTEENKKEYVRLYVNYRFMRGIEQQFLALQKGFHELIPPQLLRPFDERELELVIGGLGTIDINDWKMHTRLKHCTPDTSVVKWFWQIVESYGEEMRARLLQFVTGSSRVPLQGFKALQGKKIHAIRSNYFSVFLLFFFFNLLGIIYVFLQGQQEPRDRVCLRFTQWMRRVKIYQKRIPVSIE